MIIRLYAVLFILCIKYTLFAQENLDSLITAWDTTLQEVVVTGQFKPTLVHEALHEVQIITQEELKRKGVINLEQVLEQQTQIRISQDLALGSGMSLQGLSGENVKIMIDGVPVLGRLGGNIDLSQILMDNVERIEIIEGPMSAQFGTDALAGVVHVITNKKQKHKHSLTAAYDYETQNARGYKLGLGWRNQGLIFKINGGWRDFGGKANLPDENGNSSRDLLWNPKQQKNLSSLLSYYLNDDHKISLAFQLFDEKIENDGVLKRPQYRPYAFDDKYNTLRWNPNLNYDGNWNEKWRLSALVSYNHYTRIKNSYRTYFSTDTTYSNTGEVQLVFREDSSVLVPKVVLPNYTIDNQDTTQYNEIKFRSTIAYKSPLIPLHLQGGLDFTYDNSVAKRISDGKEKRPNFSQMGDYAAFLRGQYDILKNLQIETAIRYTYNTKYAAPLIPSFHVKYSPLDNLVFRGSYGKGFRAPSLKELYFRFIDSNHYIIGNPNLKAEKSDNFQLSISHSKRIQQHKITTKIKAFHNYIQNRIGIYNYEPQPDNPTPEQEYRYFNQAIYKTRGLSVSSKYQYKKGLKIALNISNIQHYVPLSETQTSLEEFTPSWEVASSCSYHIESVGLELGLWYRYNASLIYFYLGNDEAGNEVIKKNKIYPYSIINIMLGKSFWNNKLKVQFGMQNLLDTRTSQVTGSYSSGHNTASSSRVVSMGRNVVVKMVCNL